MAKQHAEWIDALMPTKKDLEGLQKKFRLHPLIVKELAAPSSRSRVENYRDYLFLVYYFPVYDQKEKTSRSTEIDFVISREAVATVRYNEIEGFRGFEEKNAPTTYELIYKLVSSLLVFQERQLRHIGVEVEHISKQLFKDDEKAVLEKISYLKRDISEYRIIVRLQGIILNSLRSNGMKFWGPDAQVYLNDLVGDHLKVMNQLEDYREAVSDFEDTNNQLMNLKINSVMKTFTALSFLTFPFMLLAAIFTIRAKDMPLVDQPNAFWIIVGVIALGMIALAAIFKKKNWF